MWVWSLDVVKYVPARVEMSLEIFSAMGGGVRMGNVIL